MFKECQRVVKPGSSVFIVSDFHDLDESCKESLALTSRHSDVTLIRVKDPIEESLFQNNTQRFTNENSFLNINTSNNSFIKNYQNLSQQHIKLLTKVVVGSKVHIVNAVTERTLKENLRNIFSTKKARRNNNRIVN